jgi:hypothetical protein
VGFSQFGHIHEPTRRQGHVSQLPAAQSHCRTGKRKSCTEMETKHLTRIRNNNKMVIFFFCFFIFLKKITDIYIPLSTGGTVYFAQPDALKVRVVV